MTHFRDMSIRSKVVILVMAVSLIIVTTIGGARLVWDMGQAKQALLQEVSALTNLLANRSSAALAFDDKRLAQENLLSLQELRHVVLACLYRKDGTHLAKYHRDLTFTSCPASSQVNSLQQRFDADRLHTAAPIRQGGSLLGWIYISTDLTSIEKRFHDQLLFSGITLAFAALLAGLLAVWVQRLISGPVGSVTAVANAIERRGDFSLRASVSGNDEVGQLARGFNSMLEALQIQSQELATTKAEQEALLSKYRSLFEHFGDAILLADVETGGILDVNPAAIDRYGYSRADFLSMTILDMSSADSFDEAASFIQQIRNTGYGIFEREHRTKDDRLIPGEVSCRVIELNGRPVFLAVIRDLSERRYAEQALGESESRFRSLLEQSPFSMQIMSPDGRVRLVNPAWERFWGVSLDSLSNYNILTDQNLIEKGVMPYIERGFSGEVTEIPPVPYNAKDTPGVVSRVVTPDRWVRAFISPIKDNKGVLREVVLLYEDVTEKKYTDDAIRHIASGVSAVTGEVFFNHLVGHLAKIFDAEYAFIGIVEKEDLDQISTLAVYAHGKIIENLTCSLQHSPCADTLSKGTCTYPFDVRQQFPHDKLLIDWNIDGYIGTTLFGSKGESLGILAVLNDKPLSHVDQVGGLLEIFAARAGAELERLRAEEVARKLTMAVEQSPNSVIVTNKEGVIEYVNASFTQLTGYSSGEAIGQTPRLFKSDHQDVAIFQEMWHTVLAGRIWHGELENQRKDGSIYTEEQTIAPVYNEQEKITHFIGIKQDITERLQTEEALRRSQKMDAIGQLSGGIAHDFNNQLGVVIGYLDFLKADYPEDEKQSEWIDIASKATLRCMDLTRQLLTFSRLQPKTKAVVDVNLSLKKIETMIGRTLTPAVEVRYTLLQELWPIEVDIGEFEDTLLNMVINARDAMQGDGKFTIETSNQNLDADFTSAYPWLESGEFVQVALTDTGKGMSAETLEHVFEPFFTTKPEGKGTGLGMSMVYGFAKRCGGIVKIYSEPGFGTTVRIYLPRSITNSALQPVIAHAADLPKGSETILIVDDELGLLDLAQHYLNDLGYQTQRAENAAQALQLLQGESKFDLLFSDVVMPGGVNGYQLAQQATQRFPSLRVLLTSGFASKSIEQQGLSHFSANMLNKPYRKVELANRIRLVLDEDRTDT